MGATGKIHEMNDGKVQHAKHGQRVFGRDNDDQYQLSSLLWTHNFWILSNSKEDLQTMLRDLITRAAALVLEPRMGAPVLDKFIRERKRQWTW